VFYAYTVQETSVVVKGQVCFCTVIEGHDAIWCCIEMKYLKGRGHSMSNSTDCATRVSFSNLVRD